MNKFSISVIVRSYNVLRLIEIFGPRQIKIPINANASTEGTDRHAYMRIPFCAFGERLENPWVQHDLLVKREGLKLQADRSLFILSTLSNSIAVQCSQLIRSVN